MAFFPNTAAPAPIILHHTPSDTATPALLYPGETAVCHGPTHTKFWIGDGTTNRLFLSTNPADSPLLNQSVLGGPFLPLSGGTLAGPGNLTLDGGTLTVSDAAPRVVWDKTGTNARQWSLRTADGTGDTADHTSWGLHDGGWRFHVERKPGPPVAYDFFVGGYLRIGGDLFVVGGISSLNNVTTNTSLVSLGGAIHSFRQSDTPTSAPYVIFQRAGATSNIPTGSLLGEVGFISRMQGGGEWHSARIQAVATENHAVSRAGAELQFWTAPNGGVTSGHARHAMTLEQDGNLKLLHSNPTVDEDVITLGYLTGAGADAGFLRLTGGTLSGPGNLAVNGTLAVSNSDTVSATITNTGSGATGLRITCPGTNNTAMGLDVTGGDQGYALVARGQSLIGPVVGTSWWFSSSLRGSTTNAMANLLDLSSDGGGIFIALNSRSVDPPAIFALGIRRDLPANTAAFIQMFNSRGLGTPNAAVSGDILGSIWFGGFTDASIPYPQPPQVLKSASIYVEAAETWSGTGHGSRILFDVTANGTTTAQTALTIEQDGALTVVGTVTASGTLLTSDPALKDNITQAPSGALAKVCELPVIDFRWKHGRDTKLHRGFSADDVRRVMGEDSGCSADGAYSLADMNAVLWQAMQELATEVQELRRRVDGPKPHRAH